MSFAAEVDMHYYLEMHRRMPLIIVAGYFGAGKTSLIHHMICEHQVGHLALLVESPGPLTHDAHALRGLCGAASRNYDTVREIPPGDDAAQLAWMTHTLRDLAQAGHYEEVWVELSGAVNPVHLAQHFGILPGHAPTLAPWATLQHVVTVVDALDAYLSLVVPAQKSQPVVDLDFRHSQIESASLVILNKCDLVDDAVLAAVTKFLRLVNPDAPIVQTDFGTIPRTVWERPSTLQQVGVAIEKRLRLKADAHPATAIPDAGLVCQTFRSWRPFHPHRFWDWFGDAHFGLVRMKGIVWLASRHSMVGGLSRTGQQNSCGAAGLWWDALPREDWPTDLDRLHEMQAVWREPYGDRRQELSLIAPATAMKQINASLHKCLLTDAEFSQPIETWQKFYDPFPEWNLDE